MQTIWISTGLLRGQTRDPDRGAGVPTVLAEHLDEELAGRVGDPRLLAELRRAGHEHQHLHDPHPIQVSHRVRSDGERVQHGVTGEVRGRAPPRRRGQGCPVPAAVRPCRAADRRRGCWSRPSGGSRTSSRDRPREGPDRGPGAAGQPSRPPGGSRSSGPQPLRAAVLGHAAPREVHSDLAPEALDVTRQHARDQSLVLAGDVVHVAVGAMVDREVEAELALPPVPEVLQDAVAREVVEERGGSAGARRCWPGCRCPWWPC